MTLPTRRAALVFALGLPVALLPTLAGVDWRLWAVALLVMLGAVAGDAALAMPRARLTFHATVPETLYIGDRAALRVEIEVEGWLQPTDTEVLCDLDELWLPQPAVKLRLVPNQRQSVEVPLVPARRGRAEVRAVWLRWVGPLGLVQRMERRALGAWVAVVPNLGAVRQVALHVFHCRTFLRGLRPQHHVGEGSEFDCLREYVPGFDHRALDWKATARHHKLMVRECRAERDRSVIVALDTGHVMRESIEGAPRLDHAINAALLLCYVALRSGDRVGLFGFDERVRFYLEPKRGTRSFVQLSRQTAAIEYSTAETNFTLGLTELGSHLHRRVLVIVLTDFADSVAAELMVENLGRLARRHLILFVALHDSALRNAADAEPSSVEKIAQAVVARTLLREREVVLGRLRRLGVMCIDAPPRSLSTQLVNRYLEARRRERI